MIAGFLLFWGLTFVIVTTLVALLKHETDESENSDEPHFGLIETYRVLLKVLRLPAVRSMAFILLTIKVSFAAVDSMTGLELLERGVSKDTLALLAIPLTPLEILLPFFIAKYTSGQRPLNLYAKSHPFRSVTPLHLSIRTFLGWI